MNKPGTSIVVAFLALAGCSSEVQEVQEVTVPTLCVKDSDGRFYDATTSSR